MPGGAILVCLPVPNPDQAEWHRIYTATRQKWVPGNLREMTRLTADQFFQGTDFVLIEHVIVQGEKQVELDQLVYRALGTPNTSRAILGAETYEMIAAIRAAMTPYFRDGPIMEKHRTEGFIYRRRLARNSQDPISFGNVRRNEICPCGSGKKFKHLSWQLRLEDRSSAPKRYDQSVDWELIAVYDSAAARNEIVSWKSAGMIPSKSSQRISPSGPRGTASTTKTLSILAANS
jgi:hypothetical protein